MTSPSDYRIVLCSSRTLLVGPYRFWWRLESASNGQVLATSETYGTAAARDKTAKRLGEATGIVIRARLEGAVQRRWIK